MEADAQSFPPPSFWGSTPEEEDAYFASVGIRGTRSWFAAPSGLALFARSWQPPAPTRPRALVCMLHGYGNDTSWTFQATPIFLARHGFACFALDLPGHGRSPGLRAFVPDLGAVLRDCQAYFDSVSRSSSSALPRFLFGESMGGALCLLLHLADPRPGAWAGAVLVAPMCKISDRIRPPWPLPQLLTFLARFAPTLPVVPTADLLASSVRVEAKKAIAANNPLRYTGKPRLGTVVELLRVTEDLGRRLHEVTLPFLVLHGSGDVVTDPEVSRALYETARSEDKTIRIYEGMMHSLLFGETDENVALVRRDIFVWLTERSGGAGSAGSLGVG